MSTHESLQVIGAYFEHHDEQYLAENVEFCDMTAEQPLRGREAMQRALDLFYAEAFSDASAETRNVVAADNGVVIEFVFHGTHGRTGRDGSDRQARRRAHVCLLLRCTRPDSARPSLLRHGDDASPTGIARITRRV